MADASAVYQAPDVIRSTDSVVAHPSKARTQIAGRRGNIQRPVEYPAVALPLLRRYLWIFMSESPGGAAAYRGQRRAACSVPVRLVALVPEVDSAHRAAG